MQKYIEKQIQKCFCWWKNADGHVGKMGMPGMDKDYMGNDEEEEEEEGQ